MHNFYFGVYKNCKNAFWSDMFYGNNFYTGHY